MSKEKSQENKCKKCGKSIEEGQLYCSDCLVEVAEDNIAETEQTAIKSKKDAVKEKKKIRKLMKIAALIVCMLIVAVQIPSIITAFRGKQPQRIGDQVTNYKTDKCINNFWLIAKILREGQQPNKNIVCPESGKPYILEKTDKDIIIKCPNPKLHGLKEIKASKLYPCPEVKR